MGSSGINTDFCEEAVSFLESLHWLGLLRPSFVRASVGSSEFVVCDLLNPPISWHLAFDVVVDKGLLDTLLFGTELDAFSRAARFAAAVDKVLRPGGLLLQISDAPLALRRELLEI